MAFTTSTNTAHFCQLMTELLRMLVLQY